MSNTLVTCFVNPDLDGTAGAIAYAELINKKDTSATAGIIGQPSEETKYVFNRFKFKDPNIILNSDDYEKIILVDASVLSGLEDKVDPKKVIEIIDHRKINDAKVFTNAKIQIELVGAAATLVAEKFIQTNTPISLESATLLLSAIISNTLNFKSSTTTERDRQAYQWLNTIARLPKTYSRELFLAKSDLSENKLFESIENDFATFTFGNTTIGIAQIEMIGGKNLIAERGAEIIDLLQKMKAQKKLSHIFLSLIELETDFNYFVTDDLQTQKMLEKIFSIKFSNNYAEKPGLIMRKQIAPLIKEEIENH